MLRTIAGCAACLLMPVVFLVGAQSKDRGGSRPPDPRNRSVTALEGPSLGFAIDPASKMVRPLLGLAGAAVQGAPLNVPFALDRAEAAQRGAFVLGIDQADSAVIEITTAGAHKLSGITAAPDAVVFSPSASAAALYHRNRAVVEVLEGLPHRTAVAASLNLAVLPQSVSALAVSDDGLVLAASVTGPDTVTVYAVGRHRAAAPILTVGRVAGMTFLGSSDDAVVADGAANLVYRLRHGVAPVVIAGSGEGVSEPLALAASADGKRAVVANDGGAPLVLLDLVNRSASKASCPCRVSAAEPMAGNAVFRVTAESEPLLWILDADLPAPRFLFVPAAEAHRP
jgi:hypothetical protein